MAAARALSAPDRRTARSRRRCVCSIAAVAALCSCSVPRPEAAYQRIWALYIDGQYANATQAAAAETQKFKQTPRGVWFWKFRLLEAESLIAQGKLAEALAGIKDPIPAHLASNQLEVRRLIDRADVLSRSGRRDAAIQLLEQTRSKASDPSLQIRIDLFEGGLLAVQRKSDEAERLLTRAVNHAAARKDNYLQASALLNLSYCKKWQYHYDEAVDCGLRVVALAEKDHFRRLAALEYVNLGSFYRFLGDLDRALSYENKAVELLTQMHDRGNLLVALGELGLIYESLGRFDQAAAQHERAFHISMELKRNSDAARHAVNLSEAYIELHRWDQAGQWNETSRRVATPDGESGPYQTMNDARIAFGRGDTKTAADLYRRLARHPDLYPALLWDCHSYLGNIYNDERNYPAADREFRAALDLIDKSRSDLLRPESQITFLSQLIAFHQQYVDLLISRKDDADALRIIESSRARVLAERLGREVASPQPISHIAGLAKDMDTSILSFWLAPRRSFAWLIDKHGVQRFDLPSVREIEPLVTAYRSVVEHSLKDPIASGEPSGPKLWNALLRDIAPHIPKGARVVVIPDGPLHRLNLETLPVPGPQPHYWIEDVELAIAPSLAIAASPAQPAPQRNASLLLIGAPDYAGTDYKPLAKAGAEIRDIQARFRGIQQVAFTGPAASPAAYRNSQPARFSLIHFAAHADASNESPLESAVVLSHSGGAYKLYARDVMNQPIDADLVTISGCRSAGVRAYAGEGLIGFAWAFLQAGARAVVAGLWDVSDYSTEPLMNEFYGALASGASPAAAMRHAKLSLLKNQAYAKPFYWAPFQVYVRSIAPLQIAGRSYPHATLAVTKHPLPARATAR